MPKATERWKVLVTDHSYPDINIERETLTSWNADISAINCVTAEDVMEAGNEADALITQYAPLTAAVFRALTNCKVVGRYGTGVDNIDVTAATDKGIAVVNVPSYCEDEVSDHALAMLLAWARRIPHYTAEMRRGTWDWMSGRPMRRLRGQVLGCLGFGKIARLLAVKAQSLGMQVLAHDPFVTDGTFEAAGVERATFDHILGRSDFLSVHVPLTEHTHHLVDSSAIAKMKSTACIINTSRGPVIDEHALAEALTDGRLAGACLDVLETEPPQKGSPLITMEQVLLSPHMAWYSEQSQEDLRRSLAEDIGRALNGQMPKGLVNGAFIKGFR